MSMVTTYHRGMHQNVSTEYHHDNREVQKKYEQ
jgi:hypothetical protein